MSKKLYCAFGQVPIPCAAVTTMEDDDTSNPPPQAVPSLHVSIGSAATGAHFSFDHPIADIHSSQLTALVDFCVDFSQRVEIQRAQFKARMKP